MKNKKDHYLYIKHSLSLSSLLKSEAEMLRRINLAYNCSVYLL